MSDIDIRIELDADDARVWLACANCGAAAVVSGLREDLSGIVETFRDDHRMCAPAWKPPSWDANGQGQ